MKLFTTLALVILLPGICRAQEVSTAIDADKFVEQVRQLVVKEYPEAKVTAKDSVIRFEFNLRKFMIHEPFKTGVWQDAHEELGPQPGGIYGELGFFKGPHRGQAMVPQSRDKHYFTLRLMGPYSKKLDHHLLVYFKYPRNVKPEFEKDFEALVNRFEEFCSLKKAP